MHIKLSMAFGKCRKINCKIPYGMAPYDITVIIISLVRIEPMPSQRGCRSLRPLRGYAGEPVEAQFIARIREIIFVSRKIW